MHRGYARNARDETKLLAFGLKPRAIYVEGRCAETLSEIRMRPGELLATVGGLRALGNSRQTIIAALHRVHAADAAVLDIETSCRSDKRGAEMLHHALARIKGEATMANGQATEMQAKSVKARLKGRMPIREAMAYWRNPDLRNVDAIALMRGWSDGTAYKMLGKRGLPSGRRGKR